jgi:thioredoxin-related protein
MGFYGRIAALWTTLELLPYPLVIYPDGGKEVEPEVRDFQRVTNVDYLSLGIPGTPTVLLVDRQGKVLRKWPGALQSAQESDLLSAIRRL